MKQFEYVSKRSGPLPFGPIDPERAKDLLHRAYGDTLDRLAIGGSYVDVDGDVWTRLPDLVLDEEPQAETRLASDVADERLARIAEASLQSILRGALPNVDLIVELHKRGSVHEQLARDAVAFARALIAELDKPA